MLRSLVSAGQSHSSTAICGAQRAFRNFGLHADFGCGADLLPGSSTEAKRRVRGARKQASSPEQDVASVQSASSSGPSVDDDALRKRDDTTSLPPVRDGPWLTGLSISEQQITTLSGKITEAVGAQLERLLPDRVRHGHDSPASATQQFCDERFDGLHRHLQALASQVRDFVSRENLSKLPEVVEDLHSTLRTLTARDNQSEHTAALAAVHAKLEEISCNIALFAAKVEGARLPLTAERGVQTDSPLMGELATSDHRGLTAPPAMPAVDSACARLQAVLERIECQMLAAELSTRDGHGTTTDNAGAIEDAIYIGEVCTATQTDHQDENLHNVALTELRAETQRLSHSIQTMCQFLQACAFMPVSIDTLTSRECEGQREHAFGDAFDTCSEGSDHGTLMDVTTLANQTSHVESYGAPITVAHSSEDTFGSSGWARSLAPPGFQVKFESIVGTLYALRAGSARDDVSAEAANPSTDIYTSSSALNADQSVAHLASSQLLCSEADPNVQKREELGHCF
eukprot:TRINITY_DN14599_c0_g1_i10.p1 TRINITY_DN14599_c0_g1~~TRINITY_DN14599_c0_g1_i10.p1  ORF type:complete len:515 (-),score=62.99 TRINITY_DN14599_c0_g1_i10:6-1550(-)